MFKREPKSGDWSKVAEVSTLNRDESGRATAARTVSEGVNDALPGLVRARVSVSGKDDLVVVDRVNHQMHVISNTVQRTDFSRAIATVSEQRAVATGYLINHNTTALRFTESRQHDTVATARGSDTS